MKYFFFSGQNLSYILLNTLFKCKFILPIIIFHCPVTLEYWKLFRYIVYAQNVFYEFVVMVAGFLANEAS